ncbi:MAG: hypothetical protein DMD91_25775 [Candidatus Rokuibacteriota bacterium]|nr:MAG: hypothetical protein DMD91_25775 [Candidatus Rokubacteria bacterium]
MGQGNLQPLFLGYLGEADVLAGRTEDALEVAGRALTLARERGLRGVEAWALRLLVAHCHLGVAKLSRRAGTREQTRDHLTIASTMYREMAMRFWRTQAEAIMGALP